MTGFYSPLKAAWHTRDIEALRAGRGIVPHQIYLIISDLCNQNCSFCSYRSPSGWGSENFGADSGKGFTMNPERMIPAEKAFEILDDCAALGVKAIQFTGGGEPTVHPQHEKIFSHALDLGLQIGLVTNGTRVPKRVLSRLTWIRVSVDAGTESTYQKAHGSKLWSRVLDNIAEVASVKGPAVGASFVVTRENYRELVDFCWLMKARGVSYVKISANLTTDGLAYYDGILDDISSLLDEAKTLADSEFTIVSVFERRLEDLRVGRPLHAFCGQQRFAGYIGGDLKVYRCCNTAYTRHGEIGDLNSMRYRDWFANHTAFAFDSFDARSCTHCQFIERNKIINYLVQPAPPHVEFI